jgi:hypothetical protein
MLRDRKPLCVSTLLRFPRGLPEFLNGLPENWSGRFQRIRDRGGTVVGPADCLNMSGGWKGPGIELMPGREVRPVRSREVEH